MSRGLGLTAPSTYPLTHLLTNHLSLVVMRVALLPVFARSSQGILERRGSEELVEDDGRHQRRLGWGRVG